jgi:hypothetical protein
MGIQLMPMAVNRLRFLQFPEHPIWHVRSAAPANPGGQSLELSASAGGELERSCWMVVHEHHHGMKPSEYDIREIDEDLYLAVLNAARSAQ